MRVRTDEYSISVLLRSTHSNGNGFAFVARKSQNLKFIESISRLLVETSLGLGCFLDRVFVLLAVGRPFFLCFERNVAIGEVDSDERNANWIASAAFELGC